MSTNHNRIKVSDLEKNQPNKILATNSNGELEFSDINFAGSDSYNALDYTLTGKSLDARQGKVLKDLIDNINALLASDNINLSTLQNLIDAIEVVQNSLNTILVNDLTSGGATKALTAEMGKTLQTNKVDKVAGKSLLADTEISRLGTLSNYTHPVNHPPSIITQDSSNRFVSDAEKATWNAKQSNIAVGTVTQYFRGDKTWQTLDKTATGLSNVDNTADATKNVLSAAKLTTGRTINGIAFDGTANITINAVDSTPRIPASEKGVANGVATLDASGIIPATQLPSYVDDVLEFTNLAGFPATGETGKIYVAKDTNKTYRWGGSAYIFITSGAVDSVSGRTGVVTLTKSDVGLGSVDNTADVSKNVLSATKLTTSRTINGTAFDGSANITITDSTKENNIAAGTPTQYFRGDKTWQTLDKTAAGLSNVDNTADAAKNVLSATKLTTPRTINGTAFDGTANIVITDSTKQTTGATFFVGTTSIANNRISASQTLTGVSVDGNASTATTLQAARTINGVSFNGSANITINAVDSTPRIAFSEKGTANGVATLDASGIILTTQLPSYVDDVLEFVNLAGFPATGETGKIYVAKDTNKTYRWGGSAYIYITSGAVDSVSGRTGVITLTKSDVGLSVVDNTSDLSKPVSTAMQTALNAKQATLVSGTNIKTVNGNTLLGSGDIAVSIPSHIEYNTTDLTLWNNGKGNIATNTAFGDGALKTNSSGMQLVAVGTSSLLSNTTGYMSTAIGSESLKANTIGIYNTAVGTKALLSNTTGSQNVAIGTYALQTAIAASRNIAIGTGAMEQALSGDSNIAIGSFAISGSNTGSDNIAIGDNSLAKNTSGKDNTAVGRYSLWSNTTGIGNTGFGYNSLNGNTTGVNNVASGKYSLGFNTTGSENVAIGYGAGHFWGGGTSNPNIDSSNSIYIGSGASGLAAAGFNEIVIGASAIGAGSNTSTVGNPWITKTILRGQVSGGSFKIDAMNSAPASATATGATGEIRFTSSAIYVCIATNTWVKSALTTW